MALSRERKQRIDRAVEARLHALLERREGSLSLVILRGIAAVIDGRHDRNVSLLWGLAIAAVIAHRPSLGLMAEDTDSVFEEGPGTPGGEAVRRAYSLLTRLIFKGLMRRGEL